MQKTIRKIAPLWSIGVCLLVVMAAVADPARVTDIPPQELAPALQSLARDRSFQIIYVSEEISGRRTQGAAGNLTLDEALARLLAGTGLTFKYLDEKTVTIVPALQAASVAPSPTTKPETDLQPTPLPEVTVEGQRQALEHRLSQFVATITREPGTYESLPRWHGKICPAVAGLTQDRGDFVLERISTIARAAGAPLAPQKCEPNLFVLFSPDPTKLIKDMASHNAGRFMGLSGQRADGAAVRRFAESTQPVRAWYNTQLTGAMGNDLRDFDEAELGGGRRPLQNDHPMMSRIQHDDVQELVSVLVIVDTRRIDGVKIGAVADYTAMLGLTRINLDADVAGDDSILRLFSLSADSAATLSQIGAWDAAFLKALYDTDQASKMQRQAIVNHMMRDTAVSPQ